MTQVTNPVKKRRKKSIWRQWQLMLMSIPALLYVILFAYVPLGGWIMAFQNFRPRFGLGPIQNLIQAEWVGLHHFRVLLDTSNHTGARFIRALVNTLGQSLLTLVVGFICAITLSLMLHEVRQTGIKRFIQNILYLPHFLSWMIVTVLVSMALALPASGGMINDVLLTLRIIREPIQFLAVPRYFWGIVAGAHLWRSLGWNTIIYMSAMTAIDPHMYEAASIDGASRYRKMWHITLATIRPTIILLIIMNIGWLLASGFEIQFFLGDGVVRERAENIDIFVLRFGIEQHNFGLATAAGVFRTGVSVLLLLSANLISKLMKQETLF
ncbi:MAG: ABC transporter permease subunit [Firmicutes bacterium]|nr:ABC transporter permease subunit [Bacillota bacterium]